MIMSGTARMPSEKEAIRRVLDGDVNSFEYLMTKHQDHVTKIVSKHVPNQEVESVAQDVFVRAYQSLSTFKHKSGFKQWLSSIAVRTCYDFWRKAYRSRELPMSSLTEKHSEWLEKVISDSSNEAHAAKIRQKEAQEIMAWALDRLSPEDRMVLELVYLEELSGKETAELLGWSLANVKVRSFRARKKLYRLLSRLDTRQRR